MLPSRLSLRPSHFLGEHEGKDNRRPEMLQLGHGGKMRRGGTWVRQDRLQEVKKTRPAASRRANKSRSGGVNHDSNRIRSDNRIVFGLAETLSQACGKVQIFLA
jgi:hypothetical protein